MINELMRRRALLMGDETLPYDAEIEYLESSFTQYIDTLVKITETFKSEIYGYFVSNMKRFDNLLGCTDDQTNGFGIPCGIYTDNRFYAQFGNATRIFGTSALALTKVITSIENGNATIDCEGTTSSYSVGNQIPTNTLYMFARNYNGSPSGQANARIYYCKLWNNGVLERDFIPVRVGTVGYMYDRVSKQLFGNNGTGDFILGNDI